MYTYMKEIIHVQLHVKKEIEHNYIHNRHEIIENQFLHVIHSNVHLYNNIHHVHVHDLLQGLFCMLYTISVILYMYMYIHNMYMYVALYLNLVHYRRSTMPLINASSLFALSTLSSSE